MSRLQRHPLNTLVIEGGRASKFSVGKEVWNLNLDQIESDTGRVLTKQMVTAERLGSSTYPFEAGTVLYSKLRPYLNKVVVADDSGIATTELVPLRCNPEKLLPQYLAYFLRSSEFLEFANTVVAGAKMPRMVMGEFWKYKIPTPSLPEQRRIAAILDQTNALRAMRQEALAQLDNLKQSIFIEMFGDPARNLKCWPVFQLGELITDVTNGLTRRRKDNEEGSDVVLRLRDIRAGWIDFSELNRITLAPNEAKRFLLSQGDLLFIRVNGNPDYVGRCAVFEGYSEPVYFNDHVMRVKIDHQQIHRAFLGFILNGSHGKQEIAKYRKTSAGQHTINQEGLGKIVLPIPPIALQSQFANRLNSIGVQKLLLTKSLAELDIFFDSLQHRAFRGEL